MESDTTKSGPGLRLSLAEKVLYSALVLLGLLALAEGGLRLFGAAAAAGRQGGGERQGVRLVLCLGDSVTWGAEVEPHEAYPAQLDALLRQRYPDQRWAVVNAGVPGANSSEVLLRLRRELRGRRPELVLIMTGERDRNRFNGVSTVISDDSEEGGRWPGWIAPTRLKLYRLVRLLWYNAVERPAPLPLPAATDRTEEDAPEAGHPDLVREVEPGTPGEPGAEVAGALKPADLVPPITAALDRGETVRALYLALDATAGFGEDAPLLALRRRIGQGLAGRFVEESSGGEVEPGRRLGDGLVWRQVEPGPDDAPALLALSAYLLRREQIEAGRAVLERAAALKPGMPRAGALRLWLATRPYQEPHAQYLAPALALTRPEEPLWGMAGFLDEVVHVLFREQNWHALGPALEAAGPLNPHRELHYLYLRALTHRNQGDEQTSARLLAELERRDPLRSRALQLRLGWPGVLRHNLAAMVRAVKEAGGHPVLLNYAHQTEVARLGLVRRAAEELGAGWIDPMSAFYGKMAAGVTWEELFADRGGHCSAAGNRLLAREVLRGLQAQGLLPAASRARAPGEASR